jgi:hypothetical protein
MSISESTIADTKTNLYSQMRELERLRDQVRRAELLARKSPRANGIDSAAQVLGTAPSS